MSCSPPSVLHIHHCSLREGYLGGYFYRYNVFHIPQMYVAGQRLTTVSSQGSQGSRLKPSFSPNSDTVEDELNPVLERPENTWEYRGAWRLTWPWQHSSTIAGPSAAFPSREIPTGPVIVESNCTSKYETDEVVPAWKVQLCSPIDTTSGQGSLVKATTETTSLAPFKADPQPPWPHWVSGRF